MPRWRRGLRNRLQSDSSPVRIRTLALNIHFISCEYGGHSGRVIPVPIPNTEDKSACVPYCTEVRESSGTTERCCAHSYYYLHFFYNRFLNNEWKLYAVCRVMKLNRQFWWERACEAQQHFTTTERQL